MQIRDLTRHEDKGRVYFSATLVEGATRIPVDCRYGSWQATADGHFRPVLPAWAEELQRRVRPLLKKEAKCSSSSD